MDDFDTQVQADEFEDFDFDALDDEIFEGDENWSEFDSIYGHASDDGPDIDDSFPMYLEYEGPFGLSGYDEY